MEERIKKKEREGGKKKKKKERTKERKRKDERKKEKGRNKERERTKGRKKERKREIRKKKIDVRRRTKERKGEKGCKKKGDMKGSSFMSNFENIDRVYTLIHSPGIDVGSSADEAVGCCDVTSVAGPQQRGPQAAVQRFNFGPVFLRPIKFRVFTRALGF